MSTSLHITVAFGSNVTVQLVKFAKWTDAIKARREIEEAYESHDQVSVIVVLMEGTA